MLPEVCLSGELVEVLFPMNRLHKRASVLGYEGGLEDRELGGRCLGRSGGAGRGGYEMGWWSVMGFDAGFVLVSLLSANVDFLALRRECGLLDLWFFFGCVSIYSNVLL